MNFEDDSDNVAPNHYEKKMSSGMNGLKRLLTNGSSSKVGENLAHNAIARWAENEKK